MKAVEITVFGKVQGVYFRASTREKALALGVRGWCKNQPDGTVLIHAEGEESNLERLILWCHTGSPTSQVVQVDTKEVTIERVKEFTIRRF